MFSMIIIIIFASVNVHALGISPSKKIIDYDTDEHIITSTLINNENRDITIKLSTSGPLSEYVTIPEPTINIRSDEPEKEFAYIIQLPSDIDPGPKTIFITASEIGSESDENTVGGILALTQQLQINVPYTGLYAESYVSIDASTINAPISTMVKIVNMGDQNIQSISGELNILDSDNTTIYTENIEGYNNITLAPKESLNIEESFPLKNTGAYTAQYNIVYNDTNYDSKNLVATKAFDLGEYDIKVLSTDVTNFRLGTIAKFNINLSANWNEPINDVYGTITIIDKNNATVGQTNITKTTINPDANLLTAYLDTANIKSGNYTIGIKLYAGNKIITQEYPSIISVDKIEIGATSQPASKRKNYTLIIIIVILALIILILLAVHTQNKKLYK